MAKQRRPIFPILDVASQTELFKETEGAPDRIIAIVFPSILESQLACRLKECLVKTDKNVLELFGTMMPLGSFAAQITLSYAIGLIGDKAHDDLHSIRDIRNTFAHSPLITDDRGKHRTPAFDRNPIAALCASLKSPDVFREPLFGQSGVPVSALACKPPLTDPRARFIKTFQVLRMGLLPLKYFSDGKATQKKGLHF